MRRAVPLRDAKRRYLRGAIDALRVAPWVTRKRLMLWGVGFALASVILLARDVAFHTANGLTAADGTLLAGDFANYFAAAKAAASGQAKLVYDRTFFMAFERSLVGPASGVMLYNYPPVAMLLSLPLALLPFVPALIAWVALGVGLCFELLRRLIGWQAAALAVIGAPEGFFNLFYAQNGHLTAALLAGGLMVLDRRPAIAGICFGCLAYKPQLAVLLPFALAAGGSWRAFAAAAATVVVLVLASLALFGTATWTGFLGTIGFDRQVVEFETGFWTFMPTVFAASRMFGAPLLFAYAAQMVSTVLAVAATAAVWRAPGPIEIKAAVLAVATFLATPYAWLYDTVVLIFAAAWLGREGLRTGFLSWERIAVVLLLTFVLLAIASTELAGVPLAPVILWLVLLVLLRRGLGYRPAAAGEGASGATPIHGSARRERAATLQGNAADRAVIHRRTDPP